MSINKAQRIGVFIDVQNMYYSAKSMYKAKVDFSQILKQAVNGRSLIRAIAYVIKTDMVKDEHTFFEALEKIGFEVKTKDLQVFYGGHKKGDWDIGIAMDMISCCNTSFANSSLATMIFLAPVYGIQASII